MMRFWGQPQYAVETGRVSGYELLLRQQVEGGKRWLAIQRAGRLAPERLTALAKETLAALPKQLESVSVNLDQDQFIDVRYLRLLSDFQRRLPFKIWIELTEHPVVTISATTVNALVAAAEAYRAAGMVVCLDDVGTGDNCRQLASRLDPVVTVYKYALQNVRGKLTVNAIDDAVRYWSQRAHCQNKRFVLEGLETAADLRYLTEMKPDTVQGFYYGRPHVLAPAAG